MKDRNDSLPLLNEALQLLCEEEKAEKEKIWIGDDLGCTDYRMGLPNSLKKYKNAIEEGVRSFLEVNLYNSMRSIMVYLRSSHQFHLFVRKNLESLFESLNTNDAVDLALKEEMGYSLGLRSLNMTEKEIEELYKAEDKNKAIERRVRRYLDLKLYNYKERVDAVGF